MAVKSVVASFAKSAKRSAVSTSEVLARSSKTVVNSVILSPTAVKAAAVSCSTFSTRVSKDSRTFSIFAFKAAELASRAFVSRINRWSTEVARPAIWRFKRANASRWLLSKLSRRACAALRACAKVDKSVFEAVTPANSDRTPARASAAARFKKVSMRISSRFKPFVRADFCAVVLVFAAFFTSSTTPSSAFKAVRFFVSARFNRVSIDFKSCASCAVVTRLDAVLPNAPPLSRLEFVFDVFADLLDISAVFPKRHGPIALEIIEFGLWFRPLDPERS